MDIRLAQPASGRSIEAYQHLTEQAGARQIAGAKKFLTFNMGGSLTTSVAMIWGRD